MYNIVSVVSACSYGRPAVAVSAATAEGGGTRNSCPVSMMIYDVHMCCMGEEYDSSSV